jgi:hypothetical protein
VRTARLRAPAWILLLSLSACANIWGFDELSTAEDGGGSDVTEMPGPDASMHDVTVDHSTDPVIDMTVEDVRPEADVKTPEAGRDADSSGPDVRDVTPEVARDVINPDVADVAPDTRDSAPDVTIEADSSGSTDITATGTIVALVTAPTGVSNTNIEVIRDGLAPAGSVDPMLEYDTNDGTPKTEDWIGYEFATQQTFTSVVFQDGIKFTDGGWFSATPQIQVDPDGSQTNWMPVTASVSPAFAGQTASNFTTYTFTLTPPVSAMGVRIDGTPGGTGTYVTIGELRVFAQ